MDAYYGRFFGAGGDCETVWTCSERCPILHLSGGTNSLWDQTDMSIMEMHIAVF